MIEKEKYDKKERMTAPYKYFEIPRDLSTWDELDTTWSRFGNQHQPIQSSFPSDPINHHLPKRLRTCDNEFDLLNQRQPYFTLVALPLDLFSEGYTFHVVMVLYICCYLGSQHGKYSVWLVYYVFFSPPETGQRRDPFQSKKEWPGRQGSKVHGLNHSFSHYP